jgi:hypothetical protein
VVAIPQLQMSIPLWFPDGIQIKKNVDSSPETDVLIERKVCVNLQLSQGRREEREARGE